MSELYLRPFVPSIPRDQDYAPPSGPSRYVVTATRADADVMRPALSELAEVLSLDAVDIGAFRQSVQGADVWFVASELTPEPLLEELARLEADAKAVGADTHTTCYPAPRFSVPSSLATAREVLSWLSFLPGIPAREIDRTFAALSDEDLGIVPVSRVKSRPVRWLWEYRLARGSLALMAGDGGIGKSQVLLWVASTVTMGGEWLDGSPRAPAGNVLIVSAEDSPETTIRPRLQALGADLERAVIVKAKVKVAKEGKPPQTMWTSLQDLAYWKEAVRRYRPVLMIVDPVPSYLGRGVNDSRNLEIRAVLEPFIEEILEPYDVCMIGNTHLNKGVDAKTPMHRIMGSVAYGNLPRNVHFVARDPDNPDRRFFKQHKCNLAPDNLPGFAFRIERRDVPAEDGEMIETSIPVFEKDGVQVDLAEAIGGKSARRGPDPKASVALAEWLFDLLADAAQPTPLGAIFDAAGAAGLIGTRKPDGKWTGVSGVYRARDRVPNLPEPRAGRRVDDLAVKLKPGGRDITHWFLTDAGNS